MLHFCFVDNDEDTSKMFEFIGRSEDIDTACFTSGTEALQYLENNKVDAVILDLAMPILDGLTVAEEIRRNEQNHPERKRVKIAFLTGAEIDSTVLRVANRVGVEKIFHKPCDMYATIQEIKGWF
jgi:CheY-like chemotaxis protein